MYLIPAPLVTKSIEEVSPVNSTAGMVFEVETTGAGARLGFLRYPPTLPHASYLSQYQSRSTIGNEHLLSLALLHFHGVDDIVEFARRHPCGLHLVDIIYFCHTSHVHIHFLVVTPDIISPTLV